MLVICFGFLKISCFILNLAYNFSLIILLFSLYIIRLINSIKTPNRNFRLILMIPLILRLQTFFLPLYCIKSLIFPSHCTISETKKDFMSKVVIKPFIILILYCSLFVYYDINSSVFLPVLFRIVRCYGPKFAIACSS